MASSEAVLADEIEEAYDLVVKFEQRSKSSVPQNLHEEWARLRRSGPVHKTSMRKLFKGEDFSTGEADAWPCYQIVTYDEAMAVLKNEAAFSASVYSESMGRLMGRTFLEMDGQEHKSYRYLVQRHFARKICELYGERFIQPMARKLVTELASRQQGDLIRHFTFPLSVLTIAKIVGLPSAGLGTLLAWAVGLKTEDDEKSGAGQARDKLKEIIERRRAQDSCDVVSALVRARIDGRQLSDTEIISFVRLLLSTGTEPPYRSLNNLLAGLLNHSAQLETLKIDRSLISNAINEAMRWEPPLTWALRICTHPTEIAGIKFTKGDLVCVNISSANRDAKRWSAPEKFDIYRPRKAHIGMGGGVHMCLGQHLAMMESKAAVEAILECCPRISIDPEVDSAGIVGRGFRSPRVLQVHF